MRLAIFSDIHGKILLPFKLVHRYQEDTGNKIDAILQCGDIGAYPNLANLDKATIKHARADRDELGFHDQFTRGDNAIKAFLDRLNVNMICVRGNHEDHDYLDALEKEHAAESIFPIDIYNRVFVCRSGAKQMLHINNESLSFVGIGRIGDPKNRVEKRFIQEYEKKEVRKLLKTKDDFDILITHDKQSDSHRGYGMPELRALLDNVIFRYHFYGHTGEPFNNQLDHNGITQSVKIKELEFTAAGILPPGCMVIVEKSIDGQLKMEVVDQRITNQFTKFNWKTHE